MYTLDLVTILRLLSEFRRTGILQAELPSGLPQLKQSCLVVIELLGGEMIACHVKAAKGQNLLANGEAYEAVAALGKLNWVFHILPAEKLPSKQQPAKVSPDFSRSPRAYTNPLLMTNRSLRLWIPQRAVHLNNAEINACPRHYRQVYILIDGVRTVEKIASMLSQPVPSVEEVLRELQSIGAITLQEQ